MHLTPREIDKLILHQAGFLAQKRLARGLRLNYVEAVALIATQLLELIRDGRSVMPDGWAPPPPRTMSREDTLMVATRMRDTAFKRACRSAPRPCFVQMARPARPRWQRQRRSLSRTRLCRSQERCTFQIPRFPETTVPSLGVLQPRHMA